ncbi:MULTISPECIES: metal-dependent hydrolase [unclassified Sporosarcina]|uniref:metal-dependent hydrolase n=1 Tax=unclassified Sporosarcina TaxID=2647733 RepID=UPI000C163E20|nr:MULTISPECIES: metal-dependent hydrolase [unclassified Sporosarcina]PIC99179.1 hydrolase [Sporosarcina sp. P29]PID04665.1 hydrolase [Sporosarcina sp. P30]PID07772.1 hydrolase [Sporosarcina sp. P31]PID11005.1 hydrolase [Sporosarcina sp. P32b]
MKGTSHLFIGTVVGAVAGYAVQPDIQTALIGAAVGGISGVVPDLDTNGLASNSITLSKKVSKWLMETAGIVILLTLIYQVFIEGLSQDIYVYGGIGLLLLIVSRIITQRRMLTITGILVMLLGFVLDQSPGILLAGSYIIIASFLPHRSYTHSIIGIVFYAYILKHLYAQWPIDGLVAAGLAGYISHLLADMKVLPVNRRGVKWFLPLWGREF